MRVLTPEFKRAVREVRAAGVGGEKDTQRVIVRAEPGRLALVGIGGNEVGIPASYDGPTVAVMTTLYGLRRLAGALDRRDEVDIEVTEKQLRVRVQTYKRRGRRLVPSLAVEQTYFARKPS